MTTTDSRKIENLNKCISNTEIELLVKNLATKKN